jgi:hypothetical protein
MGPRVPLLHTWVKTFAGAGLAALLLASSPAGGAEPSRPPPDAVTTSAPAAHPGEADLDPDNDFVVAPPDAVPDCESLLRAAGVRFAPAELPVKKADHATITCGAEQVVTYRGGDSGIRYNTPPLLTCTLALALAKFERILQEESQAAFGAKVVRIEHAGTYNCRKMARFANMVSEHSYANAIDLRSMTLLGGKTLSVARDFGRTDAEGDTPAAVFLRKVSRRAFDEGVFSVVLTPYFDRLHRDHFHLDMARYRVDGTR